MTDAHGRRAASRRAGSNSRALEKTKVTRHTHRFTIADHDAVETLVDKLVQRGKGNPKERLLQALSAAVRRYEGSNEQVRQAFFHGLLTGYAVALKL